MGLSFQVTAAGKTESFNLKLCNSREQLNGSENRYAILTKAADISILGRVWEVVKALIYRLGYTLCLAQAASYKEAWSRASTFTIEVPLTDKDLINKVIEAKEATTNELTAEQAANNRKFVIHAVEMLGTTRFKTYPLFGINNVTNDKAYMAMAIKECVQPLRFGQFDVTSDNIEQVMTLLSVGKHPSACKNIPEEWKKDPKFILSAIDRVNSEWRRTEKFAEKIQELFKSIDSSLKNDPVFMATAFKKIPKADYYCRDAQYGVGNFLPNLGDTWAKNPKEMQIFFENIGERLDSFSFEHLSKEVLNSKDFILFLFTKLDMSSRYVSEQLWKCLGQDLKKDLDLIESAFKLGFRELQLIDEEVRKNPDLMLRLLTTLKQLDKKLTLKSSWIHPDLFNNSKFQIDVLKLLEPNDTDSIKTILNLPYNNAFCVTDKSKELLLLAIETNPVVFNVLRLDFHYTDNYRFGVDALVILKKSKNIDKIDKPGLRIPLIGDKDFFLGVLRLCDKDDIEDICYKILRLTQKNTSPYVSEKWICEGIETNPLFYEHILNKEEQQNPAFKTSYEKVTKKI